MGSAARTVGRRAEVFRDQARRLAILHEGKNLRTGMRLRGRERALERFDERDVIAKAPNPYRGVARRLTQER